MTILNEPEVTSANPEDEFKQFSKDAGIKLEEPAKTEETPKEEAPKEEEPKEEAPVEEKPKEDESQVPDDEIDKEEDDDIKKEEKARVPKVIPAWKQKVAEKRHAKEVEELKNEIETLKNKPSETPTQKENIDDEVKALAEESGLDENILRKIVKLSPNQGIPKDLLEKVDKMSEENKELKEQILDQQDTHTFNNDFSSDVMPLIKEEYGEISDSDLTKVKSRMDKLSHMKEYATTPLDVLYKGLDTFRPIKGKKSAESGTSGKSRHDDVLDLANVTTEQIEKWINSGKAEDMEKLEKHFAYIDSKDDNQS